METSYSSLGLFALLGLGFVFGLKHATEVDHVVAVSAIVSEHRNFLRSALVGGLWGAGHTTSLVIVGVLVLVFRVAIPLPVAHWLEFGVALMIIALGVLAVTRVLRKRSDVHLHRQSHDGQSHVHVHFHEHGTEHSKIKGSQSSHSSHSHAIARVGFKPLLVGAMHGLAGSAALTFVDLDTDSICLTGIALPGVIRSRINSRHAIDVRADRITIRTEFAETFRLPLWTPNSCRRAEYCVRPLVCV